MPGDRKRNTYRRVQLVFGLILAGLCYLELPQQEYQPVLTQRSAVVQAASRAPTDPFEKMLRENPLAALIQMRAQHVQQVKDYTCTLVKQELLPSGLSAEQELEVLFRQEPYSVVVRWVRNAGLANRVIYVKGRLVNQNADKPEERELALCQPGALGAVFLKSIKMAIHGSMAKETARRAIDEFGFSRSLDLLIKYGEMAKSRGELDLEYQGEARFDNRPVWVLRRHLPYSGEGGLYPDRLAEIYIDKEYRVPVAVYCYSDTEHQPSNLLGKYEFRNIKFNVNLAESVFAPETYGM